MQAVRSKNTTPELLVRHLLFSRGFRYRLHMPGLPGAPDIVLRRFKAVVFVHGCFWHGHDCSLFRLPATRTEFWEAKISSNRLRDRRDTEALMLAGWRVLHVWECALKGRRKWDAGRLGDAVAAWLRSGEGPVEGGFRQLPEDADRGI